MKRFSFYICFIELNCNRSFIDHFLRIFRWKILRYFLKGWLINWLIDWLIDVSAACSLVLWSFDWLIDWSLRQWLNQTLRSIRVLYLMPCFADSPPHKPVAMPGYTATFWPRRQWWNQLCIANGRGASCSMSLFSKLFKKQKDRNESTSLLQQREGHTFCG